jgi:CelD/BcsL family acetyltransferase involved in cellulose biosynthesis
MQPTASSPARRAWVATTIEEFQAVGPAWDRAVERMKRPTPFLLHGWLTAWWRVVDAGADVRVHARCDGDRILAGLPLRIDWDHGGLRKASILGSATAPLADLVVDAQAAPAVVGEALADGLADARLLDLYPLPPESPVLGDATSEFRTNVLESARSPVLELDGDWGTVYEETLSSRRRSLHRRRLRQLSALGELDVVIAKTPGELPLALDEALEIHALRWRGRGDVTHFASRESRAFHRALIESLGGSDVIRILLLKVGGRTVAFVWYFVFAGRMYLYRLAFDPSVGRYSPGMVALLEALRAATDEGVRAVEFLRGTDDYKLAWTERVDSLERVVVSRARPYQLAARLVLQKARARRHMQSRRAQVRRAIGPATARRVREGLPLIRR